MAIGRITGQMLSATLNRGTTDLAIATTGDSNLLYVDASNDRIGIGLNNPSVQFQTTGDIIVGGNLTVNGTTNTINSTTVTVDDKNIELGSTASPSDAGADGGGITLKGDTDKTINWVNSTGYWTSNQGFDLTSGNAYHIGGTQVLDKNNLDLESININGSVISSNSNANISIQPSGTGVLKLSGLSIDGDVITSDDSTAIGFGENVNIDGSLDVGTNLTLSNGTAVSAILDEDNMASDSATALATQQSIKAYVDSELGNISTTSISEGNSSATISDSGSNGTLTVTADGNTEMTVTDAGMQLGGSGARVNTILDEDNMASDSDTALATQQSIKAYVDSATSSIVTTIKFADDGSTVLTADLATDTISLLGGEGMNVAISGDSITVSAEDATDTNKGVATFDATDFTVSSGDVTLNAERIQDIAGAMFSSNTETLITATYQDGDGTIDLVVDNDLANYDNSNSAFITAASTDTLTNKTFDANGTGNSLSNVEVADFAASAIVLESEGITSNDNDTTLPTSAAVRDLVDTETANVASDTMTLTNKTFDANGTGNSITNIEVADFASGVVDTDLSSVSASDDTLASAKAIKAYVDSVSGGTLALGDDASNAGAVDINGGEDLVFHSGNSITMTAGGNGVTASLNDEIVVNAISSAASTFVRINDSLETEAAQINSTLTVDGDATVKGNLTVEGTTTYIETTNTKISDPLLLLNNGNSGGSDIDSGIMVERGSAGNNAVFYWNEGADRFKAVLSTAGESATSVSDDAYATMNVGGLVFSAESVVVTSILDEDGLGSDSDTALATQQSIKAYVDAQDANIASDTLTFTNKTFDANGTGNSISNLEVADFAGSAIVIEAEGIGSNDNDTTLPTSAAVKDFVDNATAALSQTLKISDDSSTVLTLDIKNDTLSLIGGEGIDVGISGDQITVSAEDASDTNKGIASFDATDFTVSSGDVTVNAERIQDIAGAMFTSNTETLITATYQDADGTIDLVVDNDLSNYDNSTSAFITASSTDTLTNKTFDANGSGNSISNLEVSDFAAASVVTVAETLAANDNDTSFVTAGAIIDYVDAQDANIASDTLTFTNKTFDANGTGNSLSNVEVADFASGVVDTDLSSVSASDDTLASAKAIKTYVDSQVTGVTIDTLNDIGDVDAASVADGDVLIVNDDSSNVFTSSSQMVTGLRVPSGTTAQRPTVYNGIIRFNTTTGKYEGSTDGSSFTAFAMEGGADSLNKDVFTGNGGATYNFSNVTDPTAVVAGTSNGALGLLVYIDNVLQEPTQNYTVSPTAITFDENVHSGARIVVIQGFDSSVSSTGGSGGLTAVANTDVDSAVENVDTFGATTYRAAHYHYVIENDDASEYQTGQIHVIHDGTNAQISEFGVLRTGNNDLITFSVDVSGGSLRLRASAQTPNSKFKAKRVSLEVQ